VVFRTEWIFPPQRDVSRFPGRCRLRACPRARRVLVLWARAPSWQREPVRGQRGIAPVPALRLSTRKESCPEVLAENPKTATTTIKKKPQGKKNPSLEPRNVSDKELLYSRGLAYQLLLPPWGFFSLAMQIQSFFRASHPLPLRTGQGEPASLRAGCSSGVLVPRRPARAACISSSWSPLLHSSSSAVPAGPTAARALPASSSPAAGPGRAR